jgi:hypothetical protein
MKTKKKYYKDDVTEKNNKAFFLRFNSFWDRNSMVHQCCGLLINMSRARGFYLARVDRQTNNKKSKDVCVGFQGARYTDVSLGVTTSIIELNPINLFWDRVALRLCLCIL